MLKVVGAAMLVLGAGCGAALAQAPAPVETSPRVSPEVTRPVETPPATGAPVERVPAQPVNDPNRTGPDKINGLEVPQMKGEPPAPR